jgi:hypothetical protein
VGHDILFIFRKGQHFSVAEAARLVAIAHNVVSDTEVAMGGELEDTFAPLAMTRRADLDSLDSSGLLDVDAFCMEHCLLGGPGYEYSLE